MKTTTKKLFFFITLLFFNSLAQAANTYYVKPAAAGSGDGSSWENASADLQAMIDAAQDGDNIYVFEGIYKPTHNATNGVVGNPENENNAFVLADKNLSIFGGFKDGENIGNRTGTTTLSGDLGNVAALHVFIGINLTNATLLDNLQITGGFAIQPGITTVKDKYVVKNAGAGMYFYNASPMLQNVMSSGNIAEIDNDMYCTNGSSPIDGTGKMYQDFYITQGEALFFTYGDAPFKLNIKRGININSTVNTLWKFGNSSICYGTGNGSSNDTVLVEIRSAGATFISAILDANNTYKETTDAIYISIKQAKSSKPTEDTLNAIYGNTLADIISQLPPNVHWQYENTNVGNVEKTLHSFPAIYDKDDDEAGTSNNYETWYGHLSVKVNPDTVVVDVKPNIGKVYDGEATLLTPIAQYLNLPALGYGNSYFGNPIVSQTKAGEQSIAQGTLKAGLYVGDTFYENYYIIFNKEDVKFTISPKTLSPENGITIDPIPDQKWNNGDPVEPKFPDVTVRDGDKILQEGVDYELQYKNNSDPGTATVIVVGKGNYEGSIDAEFTILPPDFACENLSGMTAVLNETNFTYTGAEHKPTPTVTYKILTLTEGADYTLSYINNINATTPEKQAWVYVYGAKGSVYECEFPIAKAAFNISKKDFTASNGISVEPIPDQTYTGKAITPPVVVKDGERVLTEGVDYTVEYRDNVEAGTAKVVITGKGNYTNDKINTTFKIVKASLENPKEPNSPADEVEVLPIPPQFCDGTPDCGKPCPAADITVLYNGDTLKLNIDYTVTCSNNDTIGTGTATICGMGNFDPAGCFDVTFPILPDTTGKVSDSFVLVVTPLDTIYNFGTPIFPREKNVFNLGVLLTKGVDYDSVYVQNNINVGIARAYVEGKTGSPYEGKIAVAEFKILPRPQKIDTTGFFSPSKTKYNIGDTIRLHAVARDAITNLPSGLAVTFVSSNTAVVEIKIIGNDTLAIIVGAGTAQITAMQAGNTNWKAAPSVSRSLGEVKKISDLCVRFEPPAPYWEKDENNRYVLYVENLCQSDDKGSYSFAALVQKNCEEGTPERVDGLIVKFKFADAAKAAGKAALLNNMLRPLQSGDVEVLVYLPPQSTKVYEITDTIFSDTLKIHLRSCNTDIKDIEVNGKPSDNGDNRFTLDDPDAETAQVCVVTKDSGAKIIKGGCQSGNAPTEQCFDTDKLNLGQNTIQFGVLAEDGETCRDTVIYIEKLAAFDLFVVVKWCNLFILNLRELADMGISTTKCRWYAEGNLIAEGFSYSRGDTKYDRFKVGTRYRFELETNRGIIRSSERVLTTSDCPDLRSAQLYPNPATTNEPVVIETANVYADVVAIAYDAAGKIVAQQTFSGSRVEFQFAAAGVYAIKIKDENFKVVVK